MAFRLTALVSSLVLLLLSSSTFAQTYYVSLAGSDTNAGTSEAAAWGSIQHAMDNAPLGATVLISEGVYTEKVYVNVSGTASFPITFKNAPGATVVLDGTSLADPAMIEVYNVEHVHIAGIEIQNNIQNDAIGVLVEGLCTGIHLTDLKVHDIHFSTDPDAPVSENANSQPIIVYGTEEAPITDLLITGCEVYDCRTGYSEALAVNGNVAGFEVSYCEVHDITNIGIDIIGHEGTCFVPALDQARDGVIIHNHTYNCVSPYASAAGIYVDGGKDLLIANNTVHHNQWGIEIGCENVGKTTSNISIRTNLVYRNALAGIACGGYDFPSGSGTVVSAAFRNNTLYANDQSGDYTGELFLTHNQGFSYRMNVTFADNVNNVLFYMENDYESGSVNFDWNNWYADAGDAGVEIQWGSQTLNSYSELWTEATMDANGNFGNPFFAELGEDPDLHIGEYSFARDAGEPGFGGLSGEFDIDGETRDNGFIDCGADEWYFDTSVQTMDAPQLHVWPNPTSAVLHVDAGLQGQDYVLFDMRGEAVSNGQVAGDLNISGLAAGVYLLRVGNTSARVVIE